MKKVSVIMAVYNSENTIEASIESIIKQSFCDWELIVCDDGSTDNTYAILQEYQGKYREKILIIKNDKNSKLPFSLNRCLEYATGKYIARMDADDLSDKYRLEKQVDFLDKHPEYDACGTGMVCFDETGIIGERNSVIDPGPHNIGPSVPFFHATIMMKKQVYDDLGGYSLKKSVLRCEDVDLWFRFFANGYKGYNLEESLYLVREDMSAVKRRNIRNALNASKTLLNGYITYHYPVKQYIYVVKPLISILIPRRLKYYINKTRWKVRK